MKALSDGQFEKGDITDSLQNAINQMKTSTEFIKQPNLKLILGIDEAKGLLDRGATADSSFFRFFRHVIKNLPESSQIFSILTDTTSRLANFNPPAHLELSHRPGMGKRMKLFPPIYQIPSFDVNLAAPPATWLELESPDRLLCYGSPFWAGYVKNAKKRNQTVDGIVSTLSHFALQKLLFVDDLSHPASSLTDRQAMALLGSTIQPNLYAAVALNSDLVSSHAAQCMYINLSHDMLISEYPSQFTYSSVANQYLASDEDKLIRCIQILAFSHLQGHIATGDIGEIVSRIILMRAMQETMKTTQQNQDSETAAKNITMPFGHSVRLADFLVTLTGLSEENLNLGSITPSKKKQLLSEGRVFWNHFISIQYTPNSADLLRQLYRGMAVQCKPNQHGFDQLFPVYLQSKQDDAPNESQITLCGIQVKNQKQTKNLATESDHWTPTCAQIKVKKANPYLVLYFSLRDSLKPKVPEGKKRLLPKPQPIAKVPEGKESLPPKPQPIPVNDKLSKQDSKNRASLAFYGLTSFPFLTPKLIIALQELLDTHPNILSLHQKSSKHTTDYVKRASPEVYSPDLY
ncbi:hypothetical protein PtA15_11A164 [Puccinia triticina]|uniref:Uncharacterized protein n=1 Tax=Puccinia triticina TaxID=208348 RepID=A0ABY7CXV7_9BASI|nr:uncharacterized protein PtA15_11A164 [Puccinia triticina]WAQ89475.1 hypothetical protein PtA15_11A164 [Puccinia triticina]